MKLIAPRWNIRVVGDPARLRVRPLRIETFQFVAKAQLVGSLERRTRVVELQRAVARRDFSARRKLALIDVDAFDQYGPDR
jgi:hypothetical protein